MTSKTSILDWIEGLPFLLILVFIWIFAYVNGNAVFPQWDTASYQQIMTAYFVMLLAFFLWARKTTEKKLQTPFYEGASKFALYFIGTLAFLSVLVYSGLIKVQEGFNPDLYWQTILIQVCVVATAEELMFRGVLLDVISTRLNKISSIFIQATFFSMWHLWAYQITLYDFSFETLNIVPLVFAFLVGVILGFIALNKKYGGLSACIAVHSCYNLVIVGVLILR